MNYPKNFKLVNSFICYRKNNREKWNGKLRYGNFLRERQEIAKITKFKGGGKCHCLPTIVRQKQYPTKAYSLEPKKYTNYKAVQRVPYLSSLSGYLCLTKDCQCYSL